MKKWLAILTSLILCAGLLGGCGGGGDSTAAGGSQAAGNESRTEAEGQTSAEGQAGGSSTAAYNLRFAYTLATDHDLSKAFEQFAADVLAATDGNVQITTFPAGSLGTQPENLESVMLGSLDMCYADTSMLVTYVPEYTLINLPWLITSFETADEIFYESGIVDELDAILAEKMNMTNIGWVYQGFRAFCTTMPLTGKADCQGVKLRSPETQIYLDTFSMMGFTPTVITWTEAYTAMQSGVVDGVDTVKSSIDSYGFYEIGKYVWNSNHMFSSVGIVMNNNVLAGLPQEYQQAIKDCWANVSKQFNQDVKDQDAYYIDRFEELGATVTYTADEAEFRDTFHDYWYESAEANGYKELLDDMMAIVEKH